jgi:hypothetical protein
MNHRISLALAISLVAGCASAPPTQSADKGAEQSADAAAKLDCHRETPVGTMFAVTRCGPVLTEAERQRAIDAARSGIPPGGSMAKPGAGG